MKRALVVLVLMACGTEDKGGSAGLTSDQTSTESSSVTTQKATVAKEKGNGWEPELKFATLDGCIDVAQESVTYKVAALYCECMVDYIVAHYEADYFVTHANSVMQKLTADGTVNACGQSAKAKGG